jgi:hypothetical protein
MSEEGGNEKPPKYIAKTVEDKIGLADSVQAISTITGSLAERYVQLSGTFNPNQKKIAAAINFASDLETLKSIAESEKEQVRLMQQQRDDAIKDARRQTIIAVIAIVVAVIAVIVTVLR